jgi:signal peptidase
MAVKLLKLFPKGSKLSEFWLLSGPNGQSQSNTLITVSNDLGEETVLISGGRVIPSKASLYVEAPKERVVTGNQKRILQASGYVKYLGYALVVVLLSFSALSVTGMMKARIVLTGSMAPSIKSGDIILTLPPTRMVPKKGDVVAYVGKRFDGSKVGVFSHRIIGGDANSGFIVKGDANPSPDVQRPKIPDITGVVFFTIPFIGRLLTPKSLMLIVPLIFGLWLIFDALKGE